MWKLVAVLVVAVALTSCTAVKNWAKETAREEAQSFLAKTMPEDAKVEADANKDGTITLEEWHQWAFGGAGLAYVLHRLRRKIGQVWTAIEEGKKPASAPATS